MNNQLLAGEVVVATTLGFSAHCFKDRLYNPPAFGSFVKVLPIEFNPEPDNVVIDPFAEPNPLAAIASLPANTLFGVVYHAQTGSLEPGRKPAAFGLDEVELQRQQPQIYALLTTSFSALHFGNMVANRLRCQLPPVPARLHARVWECSEAETFALTERPDFLQFLLSPPISLPQDSLVIATLRRAYEIRGNDMEYLVRMGKHLARILNNEPQRLTMLLENLEPSETPSTGKEGQR